jgi:hypothetical protein
VTLNKSHGQLTFYNYCAISKKQHNFWTRRIHKRATYTLCGRATRERQSTEHSAVSFTLQPSVPR